MMQGGPWWHSGTVAKEKYPEDLQSRLVGEMGAGASRDERSVCSGAIAENTNNSGPSLVAMISSILWASLQYGMYRRERAVADWNNRWRRHILCSQPSTPIEPCEWLNKMLMNVWPNFMEPKLVRRLLSSVQRRLKERRPRPILSMEVQEFSLGTAPPMFGLQGAYWSMEGKQAVLNMGFEWDTNEMSVLIAAQLAGPLRGNIARIVISSIHIKGDLRLLPILDGEAVLYSFVNTPEVKIGVAFGTGSKSTPQTELPMFSSFLEKLFLDTLNRTMVEPRRRCFSLPAVDLKKTAVGGIFAVTVDVSARDLAKLDHRDSHHGGTSTSASNGSSHGVRRSERFVEIQCFFFASPHGNLHENAASAITPMELDLAVERIESILDTLVTPDDLLPTHLWTDTSKSSRKKKKRRRFSESVSEVSLGEVSEVDNLRAPQRQEEELAEPTSLAALPDNVPSSVSEEVALCTWSSPC